MRLNLSLTLKTRSQTVFGWYEQENKLYISDNEFISTFSGHMS